MKNTTYLPFETNFLLKSFQAERQIKLDAVALQNKRYGKRVNETMDIINDNENTDLEMMQHLLSHTKYLPTSPDLHLDRCLISGVKYCTCTVKTNSRGSDDSVIL